ncbi:transcriptional protein SWT1-like [Styela clava]
MSNEKKKELTQSEKDSILTKVQKDLPDKWIAQFSKKHKNRVYFFNTADGSCTWEHPGYAEVKSQPKSRKRSGKKKKRNEKVVHNDVQSSMQDASKKKETKSYKQVNAVSSSTTKFHPYLKTEVKSSINRRAISLVSEKYTKKKKQEKNFNKSLDSSSTACQTSDSKNAEKFELVDKRKSIEDSSGITKNPSHCESTETSIRDVEMLDLNISPPQLPNSITSNSDDHCIQTDNQKFLTVQSFVILDTNVLLCGVSLNFLKMFVERRMFGESSQKLDKTKLIIPWVVLQELDHHKKNKNAARNAISFLNRQFQTNKSIVRGQTIFEAATVIDGFNIENNDDRILQCCFSMKQSSNDDNTVLVTHDKNLMNKALANHIICINDVKDLHKSIAKMKNSSASLKSSTEPEMKKIIMMKNRQDESVSPESLSILSPLECKDIYKKICARALSALTFILEKEMKEAFDDLWLDIILRKPPWTLTDVLHCVRKHWLAVFKVMGVDHILQVHVEKLLDMQRSYSDNKSEDINFVSDWSGSALSLVSGINLRGKYDEPVKNDLLQLQNLHKSLKKRKINYSEDVKHHKEDHNVEMETVETNSIDFWSALNMIWTAIISHCGMIFQSLSFLPSHMNDAPEICQALSATFDTIPEKTVAARALPLVADLVQSLQFSLQSILTLPKTDTECDIIFADLLHTLWTTIQAFSIDCNIRPLTNSYKELSKSIVSSGEMMERLKTGFQQLETVKNLLHECIAAISSNPGAFIV